MIEIIIKNYLAEKLSMPVVLEVPADPPKSFVLLEKTGSSREERIDRAMLAIQSHAPSMYEAARLNERVKAAPYVCKGYGYRETFAGGNQ